MGAAALRWPRRGERTDERSSVPSSSSYLLATNLAERGGSGLHSAAPGKHALCDLPPPATCHTWPRRSSFAVLRDQCGLVVIALREERAVALEIVLILAGSRLLSCSRDGARRGPERQGRAQPGI